MADQILTQEYLQEFFTYKDGDLYAKKRTHKRKIGDCISGMSGNGYMQATVLNKTCGTHRLIYLYHHGNLPKEIDHIDGNSLNNKIENLRAANRSENNFNRRIAKNNKSGVKGVSWSKGANKWVVHLSVEGKARHFGYYNDIDYAKFIAETMRYKYHKDFARNV